MVRGEGRVERASVSLPDLPLFFFTSHLEKLDDLGDRARHALNVQLRRLGNVVDLCGQGVGREGASAR